MQYFQINDIEDLVSNQSFKRWVLSGNTADGIYWQQWIAENPEKLEWLAAAKEIIQILAGEQSELPAERVNAAAAKILAKIHQLPLDEQQPFEEVGPTLDNRIASSKHVFTVRKYQWLAAASVVLAVVASVFIIGTNNKKSLDVEALLFTAGVNDIVYKNDADTTLEISLSDGSVVALEAGGKMRFSGSRDSARREVFLSGNAFFSVAHNPSKPFIVYTKDIVAKVLGTSFSVKAMYSDTKSVVAVVTGKVSVFKKQNFTIQDARPGILEGLVITPNQQASYEASNGTISKALVSSPVATENEHTDSVFDSTPAVVVFKKLQETYGIPIVVDENALSSCSITASFKKETFYEKLAIVCQTINATYQIMDANIIIFSKGCR